MLAKQKSTTDRTASWLPGRNRAASLFALTRRLDPKLITNYRYSKVCSSKWGENVTVETNAPAEVQLRHRVPVALTWRNTRWRNTTWHVIDRPTPLRQELEWFHPLITHAPDAPRIGWRFTARCAAQDEVRTFDVIERHQEWSVQNVWG